MTDIKLTHNSDGSYGDITWTNGEIDTVTDEEEILQRVWIALNTGRGEWAFDTDFGFPYRQLTERRGVDKVLIEGMVRSVIEPITGAESIRAIEIEHDALTKVMTITVDTDYGIVEVS